MKMKSLNSFSNSLKKVFFKRAPKAADDHVVQTYGEQEDNFTGINERLQTVIKPVKKTVQKKQEKVKAPVINKPSQKPVSYSSAFSHHVYERMQQQWKIQQPQKQSFNPFAEKFKQFPKLQVTIHNKSALDKEIILWGSAEDNTMSSGSGDIHDLAIQKTINVPGGIYPQGIVFNPMNKFIYVANQLSGTVSVISSNNQLVSVIQLQPDLPGLCSPVALAVNSNASSPGYGYVYVACSVSSTVAVIDSSLNVDTIIPVGYRPVALAYNPVNNNVYVANLVSETISVIDTLTLTEITTLSVPGDPIGIGIHPASGSIYVACSASNNIIVFSSAHVQLAVIPNAGSRPVSVTYNSSNGMMYAIATDSNQVLKINPATLSISTTIAVGSKPYNAFFNSSGGNLYVQNRDDNTISVLSGDTVIATLPLGEQNIGGAYNPFNNSIYVSDTLNNSINVIGYSNVVFLPDYFESAADFRINPAIVQHARFIVTGERRIYNFRHNRFTVTGRSHSQPISFEQYANPQSLMNVAEVVQLAGTVINRKMNWRFMLPAKHSLSILIWYNQFLIAGEMENSRQ